MTSILAVVIAFAAGSVLNASASDEVENLIAETKKNSPAGVRHLLTRGRTSIAERNFALLEAAALGVTPEIVELLLAHRAYSNIQNPQGETPLTLVLRGDGAGEKRDPSGVLFPLGPNRQAIAKLLINHGVRTDFGGAKLPLALAAERGEVELVRLMLARSARVDERSSSRQTALMIAAESGQAETVAELLRAGAQTDLTDAFGQTALMKAARRGHSSVVQKLLSAGADFTLKDASGSTALLLATQANQRQTAELLIKRGARLNEQNARGDSPAKELRRRELGSVSAFGTPLHQAASQGNLGQLRQVLRKDAAGVDAPGIDGDTALMAAVRAGRLEAAELLLQSGASHQVRGAQGRTALHYAVTSGKLSVVALLLRSKADSNARDASGVTPLMQAATEGKAAIARALLAGGASAELRSREGKTALDYAKDHGSTETIQVLSSAVR
ncbi:MAG: ankyrin repeat domain-containing protein [Bdellovibrionales bacterium]|nr:ankyrin repeat domain-containing protein [Bdellovibrionales bacterium]